MNLKTLAETWPVVKGDYIVGNKKSRIAVVTLASSINPSPEAALWGTSKTEEPTTQQTTTSPVASTPKKEPAVTPEEKSETPVKKSKTVKPDETYKPDPIKLAQAQADLKRRQAESTKKWGNVWTGETPEDRGTMMADVNKKKITGERDIGIG